MFIIKNKKIFIGISAGLVLVSIILVSIFGLNLGIDFIGGTIIEVSYVYGAPKIEDVREKLDELEIGNYSLRVSGEEGFILRTKVLEVDDKPEIHRALSKNAAYPFIEERFNTVGPVIGQELKNKSLAAIAVVMVAIILFIAYAFRHVSKPVSSWKYGIIAIIALVHDVMIPVGVFSILGRFLGLEINVLFVMALLAILGYSVNDTIVVFDRTRENLKLNKENNVHEPFDETVGKSLQETYSRSINTSITTLIVLVSLYLLAGSATSSFVLALIIGVIAGTYSSIFLASPLLTIFVSRAK